MLRGVPNRRMLADYRAVRVRDYVVPSTLRAVQVFEADGGSRTYDSSFGEDPLAN